MSGTRQNEAVDAEDLEVLARQSGITIPKASVDTVLMYLGIAARMHATLVADQPAGAEYAQALAMAPVFLPDGGASD